MIRVLLKLLFRGFLKHRVYILINILGLAIGIASFILIMLFVNNEFSFDRHFNNSDRIYRVCMIYNAEGVGENSASMPFPVAYTLQSEYPEMIEKITRVFNFQTDRSLLEYEGKKFSEGRLFFADSTFFEIFDHEFVLGNPLKALAEPNSIVLTESMARKYFQDEDPIGKTLKYEVQVPLKVTGVIRDVPPETHFRFDFIASMSSVKAIFHGSLPRTWVWNPCWTYLVLSEGVKPGQLEDNFEAFVRNFFYDAQQESTSMYLQKLTDIHLRSRLDYEIQPNSNYSYMVVLSVIAVFLLIIAAINFMNLSTATAGSRMKEIGIRKVAGADRGRLFNQFMIESLVITLLAMIVALLLVELLLPGFNNMTGKQLNFNYLFNPVNLLYIAALWIGLGIMAGIYPAVYLSSFQPISILKGNQTGLVRGVSARQVLVIFQFTISIGLIIGTVMIFRQVSFLRNASLGFNPDNILLVHIHRTKIPASFDTFRDELMKNPDILNVTAMDDIIGASHNTHEFRFDGMKEDEWRFFPALVVWYDFLETFQIDLVAGRDYNRENKTDPMNGILVNESLVRHMGWGSNEEALGQKFRSLSGDERVVGVFRDFQPTSLREPAGPFLLNIKESPWEVAFFMKYAVVRTSGYNNRAVINFLEDTWQSFEKEKPFNYLVLQNELNRLYKDEHNLGLLSLIFTFLILFVAAMGLFGLASFMAEKRTKEIGIRKVMGASVYNILLMLQKEFARLILIAMVIAWPVSYYLTETLFLRQFSLRTFFNAWVFILSGLSALAVSMIIISYRAVKASLINPAETLKYE